MFRVAAPKSGGAPVRDRNLRVRNPAWQRRLASARTLHDKHVYDMHVMAARRSHRQSRQDGAEKEPVPSGGIPVFLALPLALGAMQR